MEQARHGTGLHPAAGKAEKHSIFRKLCFWKKKKEKQARPNYFRKAARQTTRYEYLWELILVNVVALALGLLAFSYYLRLLASNAGLAILFFFGAMVVIALLGLLLWKILTHNAPPPKLFKW